MTENLNIFDETPKGDFQHYVTISPVEKYVWLHLLEISHYLKTSY